MRLIKLLLFFLLLLANSQSFAQFYKGIPGVSHYYEKLDQIDERINLDPQEAMDMLNQLQVKAKKNDNNYLLAVLDIYRGTILYYNGLSDSALVYFDQAITTADQMRIQQLRSTATIRKLFILQERNNVEPILTLMKDEYAVAVSNKDTLNMIYALNGQAICLDDLGDMKACANSYMKALDLSKKARNDYEYGFLLNNLGLLKLRMNSPEGAIKDFRRGLKIASKLNNVRLELTLKENIGFYYQMVDSIENAEKVYKETFKIASEKKFAHLVFNSLVNLGSIQYNLGNFAKGDSIMGVALNTAKKEELYHTLSPIYLSIARFELQQNNFQVTLNMLDSALFYSKFGSINDTKEGILYIKYQLYTKLNDFEQALRYYVDYSEFRDSLDRNGSMQMITELQLKYDYERKEKEHEKVMREYDSQSADMKRNFGIGVVITIVFIGFFIVYYFINKSKREAEFSAAIVNKLEEEKGRIARDLHDGIGQSLVILKNKLHNLKTDDHKGLEQLELAFDETIEEVRAISRSLIPPELKRLGLRKAIAKMIKDIEESTGIIATADTDALEGLHIDESANIRIYRIIQELTNNSIKHAEASSIRIVFQHILGRLIITYQDNGKGISNSEVNDSNSVGMKSIVQRLKYLNGSIKIEKQEKGFKATIKIRLND